MKEKLRPGLLAVSIVIPLTVGGLSAALTGDMMKEYFFLNKPPLSPPGWLFPIVWTLLYVLMGLAAYLVMNSSASRTRIRRALVFYGIQLVLNFFWPLIFFNSALYLWAFVELIVMWVTIVATTALFVGPSTAAGTLMLPYVLWTSFALYLNFAVYQMSITPMPLPR